MLAISPSPPGRLKKPKESVRDSRKLEFLWVLHFFQRHLLIVILMVSLFSQFQSNYFQFCSQSMFSSFLPICIFQRVGQSANMKQISSRQAILVKTGKRESSAFFRVPRKSILFLFSMVFSFLVSQLCPFGKISSLFLKKGRNTDIHTCNIYTAYIFNYISHVYPSLNGYFHLILFFFF